MNVHYQEDHAVIIMEEKVAIFRGVEEFKEILLSLCSQGYKTIVLDFSHLIMIDTSGLSQLLIFQHRLKEQGGGLEIINITSEYIREMFETIELYKVISIEGLSE